MKQKTNFLKAIGPFIMALLIVGIAYLVYTIKTSPDFQAGTLMKTPPIDYMSLFNDSTIGNLKADVVLKPKYDSTICRFLYNKGNYIILEYAINVGNVPLSSLIEANNKNELDFRNTTFQQIRCSLFTTSYETILPTANHLRISLYGSTIKTTIKNDTIVSLYSKIKNMSIKYNDLEKSAIFCQTEENLLPVELLFIKRKNVVYFLLMSTNLKNLDFAPNTLSGLIK